MTNDARLLNDSELAAITGGGSTPSLNVAATTIALPHIPQVKDLLTPQQIETALDHQRLQSPGPSRLKQMEWRWRGPR